MKGATVWRIVIAGGILLATSVAAQAADTLPLIVSTPASSGGYTYSLSIQTLLIMTALAFLPAAVLMMSAFTRIVIVLALLRQALGTIQVPSNQILIGLSLFLTLFVMAPTLSRINSTALKPLLTNKITASKALERAQLPLRKFMIRQTRWSDLRLFLRLDHKQNVKNAQNVPFTVLIPAFITSELKTAFQIGFLLFIPFLIIDMVVASVLMSLGMLMLSPVTISLPFKLMLFVLVNGWALTIGSLVGSFQHP